MTDPRRTLRYQQKRKKFLSQSELICHWCGMDVFEYVDKNDPRKATVDHVIEVDKSSSMALDESHWVVACLSCNSSRGARYSAAKRYGAKMRKPSRRW